MNVEDLILVSIDDHVIEPANMFDAHLPATLLDKAPKLVVADGLEKWIFQGAELGSVGLNAVVGWPKSEWGLDPSSHAEMRPGAYDVDERVRDMNRNGVLASMCFPSFAGFSARYFQEASDQQLALTMLRAYNDWHIDEWCASHPGRFIPLAIIPVWDIPAAVAELKRVRAKGCQAVTMPELPHLQGLPSYLDLDYWGPFFQACSDEQVVMCLHIGQGFGAIKGAPNAPLDNMIILSSQVSVLAAQDLLWGGAFLKFPQLKVAWSEGGIGWVPFYLDRCDRHYTNHEWLGHDWGKLPSEVFKEHSLACFITDPTALKVRHDIGIDIIAWECDYPHSDAVWPNAPESLKHELDSAGVPDDEIHKITWGNTARFFQFNPFQHITAADATVGALRALSPDVDTTVRSRHEWKRLFAESGQVITNA